MNSRIFTHPLLTNPRSRSILISFCTTVLGASIFLWIKLLGILAMAGLDFNFFLSPGSSIGLKILISPYFQIFLVILSILAAAATTAISIVGPVRRLERWLNDWDEGHEVSPLKSRTGDSYDNLIRLINDLYSLKIRKK